MRLKAKRDGNELEIVAALRYCGASVTFLSLPDVPDLLVGFQSNTYLIEIKSPKGKLREGQQEWINNWRGGDVHVVRTVDEALNVIKLGRAGSSKIRFGGTM